MTTAIDQMAEMEGLAALPVLSADQALVERLPPSLKLAPVYGPSTSETRILTYKISGSGIEEAIRILERSMFQAPNEVIEKELARLIVATKSSADDDMTHQLRITVYRDLLSKYPADAVIHCCRAWADHNVFFPAWAELREKLEARIETRRQMLSALRQARRDTEIPRIGPGGAAA